jgi:polyisoprenoid-binding protein YceI
MNKLILTAALSLSSLAFASNWEVDSSHASANFSVKHMTVSNVKGTLGKVTGTVAVDDKDLTKSKIDLTIDVTGIDTKTEKRDQHLKSPDFFDTAKFPNATFKSTKIEKISDTKLKITGDLTMHGVTKSVTLDTELSAEVANPFTKTPTRAVSASGTLSRKDFGLVWSGPANAGVIVGDEVAVSFDAEVTKAAVPAAAPAAPAKK